MDPTFKAFEYLLLEKYSAGKLFLLIPSSILPRYSYCVGDPGCTSTESVAHQRIPLVFLPCFQFLALLHFIDPSLAVRSDCLDSHEIQESSKRMVMRILPDVTSNRTLLTLTQPKKSTVLGQRNSVNIGHERLLNKGPFIGTQHAK